MTVTDPWQAIMDVRAELLRGGQTDASRCRAALRVLRDAGITFTGRGPTADAIRSEVDADESKDAEIKRLRAGITAFLDECEDGVADLAALRKLVTPGG